MHHWTKNKIPDVALFLRQPASQKHFLLTCLMQQIHLFLSVQLSPPAVCQLTSHQCLMGINVSWTVYLPFKSFFFYSIVHVWTWGWKPIKMQSLNIFVKILQLGWCSLTLIVSPFIFEQQQRGNTRTVEILRSSRFSYWARASASLSLCCVLQHWSMSVLNVNNSM